MGELKHAADCQSHIVDVRGRPDECTCGADTRPRTEGCGEGEPVAWRWRPPGRKAWGYTEAPRTITPDMEVQPLYASPIREPEISREAVAQTLWNQLRGRAGIKHFLLHVEGKDTEGEFSDHEWWLSEVADAILNLAPVGGRGEEGSAGSDLSPASRSPDQRSDGEWHMVHGRWGLFFPGEPLATPEQRQAFQAPWIAHAPLMDAARNAVVAWAEDGNLTSALHELADAVSRHEPEALSGAQRSEDDHGEE